MAEIPVEVSEITATYAENYHSSSTDKFIMSRAECSLKAQYFPNKAYTKEDLYDKLLAECQSNVHRFIERATYVDPEGGF